MEDASNEPERIPAERSVSSGSDARFASGASAPPINGGARPNPGQAWSARKGIAFVILDSLEGMIVVYAITRIVLAVASPIASQPTLIALGIWTALSSLAALPALVVLHLSPPRVPLSQRSALFSSAKWFGRTIWAALVFSVSIVLGTVTGVVASRVSDTEQDLTIAIESVLATTAQIALWPILAGVAALAYIVMSIRWLLDLGKIADSGGAHEVWARLEQRWFGTEEPTVSDGRLRPALAWLLASFVGRFGLIATLLTVGLDVAITWTKLVRF